MKSESRRGRNQLYEKRPRRLLDDSSGHTEEELDEKTHLNDIVTMA